MATAKKRRTRKWPLWARLMLLVLFAAVAAGIYVRLTMTEKLQLGTAFGAHVACSCHYIGGRDLAQCTADFEPGMEAVFLSADDAAQSVTAYVPLLASAKASYREGEGCVLEPWQG